MLIHVKKEKYRNYSCCIAAVQKSLSEIYLSIRLLYDNDVVMLFCIVMMCYNEFWCHYSKGTDAAIKTTKWYSALLDSYILCKFLITCEAFMASEEDQLDHCNVARYILSEKLRHLFLSDGIQNELICFAPKFAWWEVELQLNQATGRFQPEFSDSSKNKQCRQQDIWV